MWMRLTKNEEIKRFKRDVDEGKIEVTPEQAEEIYENVEWFHTQMKQADLVIVLDFDGYIGTNTYGDIMIAKEYKKRTVFIEEPFNRVASVRGMIRRLPYFNVMPLDEILARAREGRLEELLST